MTYEQKIRFLKSYQTARVNAEVYYDQIIDLRKTMLPSGIRISDMPKHPSYDDKMADYAGRFWEINEKLEKAKKRMIRVIAVINQIAESDPLGHQILHETYINNLTHQEVCDRLYISRDTEWRHRKSAIGKLNI